MIESYSVLSKGNKSKGGELEMQRKDLLLSVIGVVVLVFVMGLVGGCHSPPVVVGESDDYDTWWLSQVPQGYESWKLVIKDDGTWTLTKKPCDGDEATSSGTWDYCPDAEEYTMEGGALDGQQGKVADGQFTFTGGVDPLVFTRTQPTSPCP